MIELPETITRYLDCLTPEQEDRVLAMRDGTIAHNGDELIHGGGCLVQRAEGNIEAGFDGSLHSVAWGFDTTCHGKPGGVEAIKDHIMANRLSRSAQLPVPVEETAR